MNYEELLSSRQDGRLNTTQLPIGTYYRMQIDGKYRGMIDIRKELNHSVVFSEALKRECEYNRRLTNPHQLHFTPMSNGDDIQRLEVEHGVYLSLQELIDDNPATLAQEHFFDHLLESLVDITTYLHKEGLWHVCFSPRNIMVRKGDNRIMLLSHGSFYRDMNDQSELYGTDAQYVAPEVLQHEKTDGRCDVYSIGKLLETLFERSSMPMEYKEAIKRATSENPDDRFATPEDLLKAVQQRRNTFKSIVSLAIAVVIALFVIGLYFDMMPESEPIEFVKPAPRQATDDLIEHGYDPAEMGITTADSLSEEDRQTMKEYEAKAEAIFKKKYEAEANRILDKIYNKDFMSNSEKIFLSKSKSVIEELVERQQALGEEAGLDPERSERIAGEINERLTNAKKKALGGTNKRGIQK